MVFKFQFRVKYNAKIPGVIFDVGSERANMLNDVFSSIFGAKNCQNLVEES